MNEIVPIENLVNKIIYLRGQKVMLDSDLAELYGVETKALKRATRRNIERFPEDFMFEITGRRIQFYKEPIWHLKERTTCEVSTLCIYRTGNCHAFFGVTQ